VPNADFFARLGIFVARNFFDEELRQRICTEMRGARSEPSSMRTRSGAFKVNTEFRRSRWASVSEGTLAGVQGRLLETRPALERHFDVTLHGCEEPQFLLYREHDFYRPHKDSTRDANAADYLRQRRVSVVVFLNQQSDEASAGTYSGGALTFYGLVEAPELKDRGMRLASEPSLLVGFRSDLMHEVTPVTRGERLTIVTWFY
jgi:SM-20-related protein